ncbi:hypothetical protein ABIF96_000579 [Bradyrhizobium ottawaense]
MIFAPLSASRAAIRFLRNSDAVLPSCVIRFWVTSRRPETSSLVSTSWSAKLKSARSATSRPVPVPSSRPTSAKRPVVASFEALVSALWLFVIDDLNDEDSIRVEM